MTINGKQKQRQQQEQLCFKTLTEISSRKSPRGTIYGFPLVSYVNLLFMRK